MNFDKELDARGLNCPLPILKAKKALADMASGDLLRVVSTDPGSTRDFQAFARQTGNELLSHSPTTYKIPNINDLPPFDVVEPSAENQARWFHDELKRVLPADMSEAVLYVKVWETPTQFAMYSEKRLWI